MQKITIRFRCPAARPLLLLIMVCAMSACSGETRDARTSETMLQMRAEADKNLVSDARNLFSRLLARTKTQYDDYQAHRRAQPPVIDILIISGGGDYGAFGSGFLKGWAKVPADAPLAKPDFAAVTGVSTGALIAPFAFLGDAKSAESIDELYRNPQRDWVQTRGWLYFLPSNISFAEVPGLERELRTHVDLEMIRHIAEKGADGRVLAVNTTNLDDGTPHVWDVVTEARRALATGDLNRIHNIMLASAGIPAAFPFRLIDGQMYVDGGVTGNIIYGGRLSEEDSLPALWQRTYPDLPIPKIRYWVIFNNYLRPPPQVTAPNWPAVIHRSLEMGTRAATLTSLRELFDMAEISALKRHAQVEVRIVAIPGDWIPPKPGVFIKETMSNLADLGERMGANPASWDTKSPDIN